MSIEYSPEEIADVAPYLSREAALELENLLLKRRMTLLLRTPGAETSEPGAESDDETAVSP